MPAPHHPHLGHALAYHLALRANTLHAPSQCTEMSPSPPASQAPAIPHTASPGYGEVLTELLPPVRTTGGLEKTSPYPPLACPSLRPILLPSPFPFLSPFHFFFPSWNGEGNCPAPEEGLRGGGDRRQTPLPLFKASGPPPPK